MSELALYVTRIEGYGAEGSSFSDGQCVFYVESIDENLCKVVLHEPVSAGEWSSVSTAIQLALETIEEPLRREKISDDADGKGFLTISEVHYRDIHLKSPSGFYNLPIVRENNGYACHYEPWAVDVFTLKMDDLWSEVHQAIAYSWKAFVLEGGEWLSHPALQVRERLLADWTPVETPE